MIPERFSDFCRGVDGWPRTRGELTAVSERIAKLVGGHVTAVLTLDSEERIGIFSEADAAGNRFDTPLVEELMKARLRKLVEEAVPADGKAGACPGVIELPSEAPPLTTALPGHVLTAANIPRASFSHDTRSSMSAREQRQGPGAILVASVKPLGEMERVLLLAATQKLSELSAIARLEAVIQLRSQFLSIASHEFKTPLTSIYGVLQLQQRMARLRKDDGSSSPEEEERKRSFLKIMIRQVERLTELIDGLLDVSRIQNGRFQVEPAETDVVAVVRETVNSRLSVIAQENGATLQLDVPEQLRAVVDPVRMEEVVTNLVMNGIRFSPEGGVVRVGLRGEVDGALRLTVRDQGPNVPVEDRERIFQPFERAQRTSRLGGLGLGLFISRQIAQMHGGNVTLLESVPGKGNVFEAYFPGTAARGSDLVSA